MLIIFGTRARHSEVGRGEFVCPRCGVTRNYVRKKSTRYFTLYFIPIIPMGNLGEYVQCQTCFMTFKPEILQFRPKQTPSVKSDETLANLMNNAQSNLKAGLPVDFLVRDLTQAGMDLDMARKVIDAAIGTGRHRCTACGLSYATTVNTCRECGADLTTAY